MTFQEKFLATIESARIYDPRRLGNLINRDDYAIDFWPYQNNTSTVARSMAVRTAAAQGASPVAPQLLHRLSHQARSYFLMHYLNYWDVFTLSWLTVDGSKFHNRFARKLRTSFIFSAKKMCRAFINVCRLSMPHWTRSRAIIALALEIQLSILQKNTAMKKNDSVSYNLYICI